MTREAQLYYRHRLPVRIMHWINVVAFVVMLMSGLMIFNAHPTLYWGNQSYAGALQVLHIGHGNDAFPGWLTIPSTYSLALARRWHLFFMWIFVVNGIAYVLWSAASRHLTRDLAPTPADLKSIWQSIKDHARFKHPTGEAAKRYNVLQKLAYLVVIFVLLPLVILMGLAMSPSLDALWPGWVDVFGGRQSARTLHFVAAAALVAFMALHVFLVITYGLWNQMRSMVTGRFRVDAEIADE